MRDKTSNALTFIFTRRVG